MAHGATNSLHSSVGFIHDLLMVLTTTDALQPLFLGPDGLPVLLRDLDRQQGGLGHWQDLELCPGLRRAVAAVIAGGTAVLFEPESNATAQLLPPLKVRLAPPSTNPRECRDEGSVDVIYRFNRCQTSISPPCVIHWMTCCVAYHAWVES